jgi:hypothetical protein
MSKFLGSVVKSVVIGLVASYAIKYIQDKYLNKESETEDEDAVEVAD